MPMLLFIPDRQIIGTLDYGLFDPFMRTNALGPLKITENAIAGKTNRLLTLIMINGLFLDWRLAFGSCRSDAFESTIAFQREMPGNAG